MARYQPQGGRGSQPRGMLPGRPQLPPPEPPVRQRALTALLLGVLSLIGLMLGLGNLRRGIFVAVLTLLFAAAAIWLGVTASKKARRSGTARPRWAVGGVLLGSIGLAFSALWLLVLAVFWPQLNTYYNCMSGANTVTAQQVCHDQFTKSVGSEISVLQNGRLPVLVGGGPGVDVDPVPVSVVCLVALATGKERVRRWWLRTCRGGLAEPLLGAAQDEPVRAGRG
jgi:hypothetical protein